MDASRCHGKAEFKKEFRKSYYFDKHEEWRFPIKDKFQQQNIYLAKPIKSVNQFSRLTECRERLNESKCKLSDYDIAEWHQHTQLTNVSGQVKHLLKRLIAPELCTQAWCKFSEILGSFPNLSLPDSNGNICSVHLCEGPGAFISALNHHLHNKGFSGGWTWKASTHNPYYEGHSLSNMIQEDFFISNTIDHWIFGEDNTGDLFSNTNQRYIIDSIKNERVTLVTADGSIDCANNPAGQEKLTAALHFAETALTLRILAPHGSFVLKMFTLFEYCSVSLIYLLNCAFHQVFAYKPATSKPGNSEVYIICLDYLGIPEYILPALTTSLVDNGCIFSEDQIPLSFLHSHESCALLFADLQMMAIERNIRLFTSRNAQQDRELASTRKKFAQAFIDRFEIKKIPDYKRIVTVVKPMRCSHDQWLHSGSYNARVSTNLLHRFSSWSPLENSAHPVVHVLKPAHETMTDVISFSRVYGKPYNCITSSIFCSNQLLMKCNEMRQACKELTSESHADVTNSLPCCDLSMNSISCNSKMSIDHEKSDTSMESISRLSHMSVDLTSLTHPKVTSRTLSLSSSKRDLPADSETVLLKKCRKTVTEIQLLKQSIAENAKCDNKDCPRYLSEKLKETIFDIIFKALLCKNEGSSTDNKGAIDQVVQLTKLLTLPVTELESSEYMLKVWSQLYEELLVLPSAMNLLFFLPSILSRFIASLVYTVTLQFELVVISQVVEPNAIFVFCKNYSPLSSVSNLLTKINSNLLSSEYCLLQFCPMDLLLDGDFYDAVSSANDHILHSRFNKLLSTISTLSH